MLLQLGHLLLQLQSLQVHLVQLVGKLSLDGVHVQGFLQHLRGHFRGNVRKEAGSGRGSGTDQQGGQGSRRRAALDGRKSRKIRRTHAGQPPLSGLIPTSIRLHPCNQATALLVPHNQAPQWLHTSSPE